MFNVGIIFSFLAVLSLLFFKFMGYNNEKHFHPDEPFREILVDSLVAM